MKTGKKSQRRYTKADTMKQYIANLRAHGDKVAYRYYTDVTCRRIADLTYTDLADRVVACAAALDGVGLAGGRIAIIAETSVSWITAYLGAVSGGSVAIPIDRELPFDEILGFLAESHADAVVYGRSFDDRFDKVIGTLPTVRFFFPVNPGCPSVGREGVRAFSDFVESGLALTEYRLPDPDPEALAEMLFTSGTTGTSKCVMLCRRNILATVNSACESVEFFPEDTLVSVLPIHHTYELCCMLAALNYGMTIGINDSIRHALRSFATFRPTGLILVPLFLETMYKKIWDEARKKKMAGKLRFALGLSRFLRGIGIDLRRKLFSSVLAAFGGRLERIVCGGAPLDPKIAAAFDDFGITVMEGYGITECSPLISVNPYFALKRGSVGPAVPCCDVRIDDAAPGEHGFPEGEITVRGDNVMLGYCNNEEENTRAFTPDGRYRTGDIGYMDGDGYIFITGRKKSVIVLENGKNVFPEEIEEYLARVPGVLESVVVGRKAEESNHVTLTAVIVPDPEVFSDPLSPETEKALHDAVQTLNKKLVAFKQIRAIEIRPDPFEKTTSRKIKRHLVH